MAFYKNYIKPSFDFLIAFIGLLIFSPIFIVLVVLLLISNNGKPFFYQDRPGKNGKIFKIIKFKTMNDKRDANGELLKETKRITLVGAFLRKFSIDEVPQLINVLKGEMSIIGPRPLLTKYLPLYNDFQKQRHNVKPGVTGWAQVNGRNAISWDEKFKFDIYYVNNISFALDVKIFLLTIKKIFANDDVYTTDKERIMPEFKGSIVK